MNIRGYLIDTNIAIAMLAKEEAALEFVRQSKEDKMPLFFSVIAGCEVFSETDHSSLLHGEVLGSKTSADQNGVQSFSEWTESLSNRQAIYSTRWENVQWSVMFPV
ncbi:MAG: hypothetical protein ACYC6C_11875 [Coriobacteriia bacterium]